MNKDKIEEMLKLAQSNLSKHDSGRKNYIRLLGCMEMGLVLLGKIEAYGQLPYKQTKVNVGLFRTRMIDRKESYDEMIQREYDEYFSPPKQ
tara:strand:- start:237 stop:509 length:273 start_codon:yes stop_codon:yes gene_type:complete